ncbi:3-hydroxy-3-methylglutaryl-CoA reductase [Candidatus Peregrinibacteria bacterium CG10_big_fil_rev_8_21_14_0_10_49_24]|nr:MAG: 3-hydroxy-3-methylglutaryl-CoA reductase [Candidatus Peregrinibacteria bacterium CG11_big_fil_rev_8_21_14_0_20_49_14]PIR51202.1 MAG: 3-hydroxy-3-methylglutaryl-CoA reductase [Candidatus Peregrinibacteria bacterium CG10_big_fil_rev_8_21_14_0_10_49_24]PJA67240.1 MAG: 3-hydroxy-3-methylglutaryl-CoA reductase [Candidatus Peregrinibacteria bacterium CG_4_9_14_3_um_filter_49_12]
MDLRSLPDGLSPQQRCDERRRRIEQESGADLSFTQEKDERIGQADEKNCEQMFGSVPLPVGYAGPLTFTGSSGEKTTVHLPLATTEGALVASVNRGCKVLSETNVHTDSVHHGITRSLAFAVGDNADAHVPKTDDESANGVRSFIVELGVKSTEWKQIAQSTSNHLRVISHDVDAWDSTVFLTLAFDTDEAMGMNMATIAAQAVAEWIVEHMTEHSPRLLTVAGNVDSDKKPSKRTHDKGRGYEVTAEALLPAALIRDVLKTSATAMKAVAEAKLEKGSVIAGAIGSNLHAANIVAALYLATGQDAAHTVEGSLTDTTVERKGEDLLVKVRLPAVLVGVRGGGTALPAQHQCLQLLLGKQSSLHPKKQLAETIGAAVLAGEISLLAAQANHSLASAHKKHAR